jgi:nitrite reductase/ring-hydroxylating ferredoxin subunit
MLKKFPKILAHSSSLNSGNFVTPEYIINKSSNNINLFNRYCPHRMYPLADPGTTVKEITCKFHGFQWSQDGEPINNQRNIHCGSATVGRSGLIFKNFVEPDNRWVDDLSKETDLKFSHCLQGKSSGSWLWMMDIQADLLHIWKNGIHKDLAAVTNLDDIEMDQGDGWILQTCSTGWWLFVYPFTFVEWSSGCVSVNYTIPDDANNEFGFTWITQFYYNNNVAADKRAEFETLEDVFHEDVKAIESQKGKYFPLMESTNRLEDHCLHYGQWIRDNRLS